MPVANIAAEIVSQFGMLSYNASDWEKLIGVSSVSSHGCLLDAWNIACTANVREQLKMSAAAALRKVYPEYTNSRANWERKVRTAEDIDSILRTAFDAVMNAMAQSSMVEFECDADYYPASTTTGANGFVPWRQFRKFCPTSSEPGIYVLAYFADKPEDQVDILSEHVIYIGQATDQSTGDRLLQFERTALGGSGHSAGFSYRVQFFAEVFKNQFPLLKRFNNTYCSWLAIPRGSAESPSIVEHRLICQFKERWQRRPRLNRTD